MDFDTSLDAIGIDEGTDKSLLEQDYLRHYERTFAPLRDQAFQLLEIGVAEGGSLRSWSRFFPSATIIGVDINQQCSAYATDRVRIEIGSQSDPAFLADLARKYRPFIVIDDGSHRFDDSFVTFDRLFPFLEPGGYYVVEDLHLHYGNNAPGWSSPSGRRGADYFADLARQVGADFVEPSADLTTRYVCSNIDSIEFVRRAVIIRKSPRESDQARIADVIRRAFASNRPDTLFNLSGYLVRHGDIRNARDAASRAVGLKPLSGDYLVRLADLQLQMGERAAAAETARKLMQIAPEDIGIQRFCVSIIEQSGAAP
jgi:tetratricopeptide (TPR) repeat protein